MTGSAQRKPASEQSNAVSGTASAPGTASVSGTASAPGTVNSGSLASHPLPRPQAAVIVNADDWGCDVFTTDRILECVSDGVVSSASAMVFMQDSERAAELARAQGVDAGLHLNLTLEFSGPGCSPVLRRHLAKVKRFLRLFRLAPVLHHPGLAASFDYLVRAQMEEYERLYGMAPRRIDGHHHMHLCANVMRGHLLPAGIIVRRNFSFRPGEKSSLNRAYRSWRDRQLAQRYRLADYFFNLTPISPPERLRRIFALGAQANVEIETHPVNCEEYRFLRAREFERYAACIARGYALRSFSAAENSCSAAAMGGTKS